MRVCVGRPSANSEDFCGSKHELAIRANFNAVNMDESLTYRVRASDRRAVKQNEQISSKEDEAAQCRQTRH